MQKYVIALYIRLSIEDYKYDSLSIENQSLVLHEYAASMPEALNAEITEFIDNGYSGTNFERPQVQKLIELKDYMTDRLGEIEGTVINSKKGEASAPQIVSVSFEGVRSEVLLHALEDKGVYVSSGSACSSNHPGISGTLKGIGVAQKLLDSTIRMSFGMFNTKEEVDYTIDVLKELVPVLRRYQRG